MFKYATGVVALIAIAGAAQAQDAVPNSDMSKLDMMKGVWSGEAKGYGYDGKPYTITQTERVGAMLGGDVLVIEGRGYGADGAMKFNAFGVISFNKQSQGYEFRAYNGGFSVTAPLTVTATGAVWEMPAGPKAIMRFTMDFTGGTWHETGLYIADGQAPVPTLDMTLMRRSDTDWPAAGAVQP